MALGPARRIASASTLALARAIPSFTHRQRIERLLGNTCAAKAACRMQKTRALYASRPLPDSPSLQDVVTMTQRSARTDKVVIVAADAYRAKPFTRHALLPRVRAGLPRRPPRAVPGAPSIDNDTVNFGPFSFNLGSRTLKKDGEALSLTDGEFAMLKALVRHPRQPLSRGKLAQFTHGREFEPFGRSLDVQISRLRKLLESDAETPRYIQTVWGLGYVFVPDGIVRPHGHSRPAPAPGHFDGRRA